MLEGPTADEGIVNSELMVVSGVTIGISGMAAILGVTCPQPHIFLCTLCKKLDHVIPELGIDLLGSSPTSLSI